MKVFWLIVAVLVLVVGAMMLLRGQGGGSGAPASGGSASSSPMTPPARAPEPAATPPIKTADSSAATSGPAETGTDAPSATSTGAAPAAGESESAGGVRPMPTTSPASGISPKPVDPARAEASVTPTTGEGSAAAGAAGTTPAPAATPAKRAPSPEDLALEAMAVEMIRDFDVAMDLRNTTGLPSVASGTALGGGAAAAGAGGGAPPTMPADPNAKAKLSPRDDGTVMVDDRFVIKGKGEKANPYVVSWEMLVSAQETYQPRLGRKIIPDRLKMLDGKWVRIAGFIAFPIMAQSQDEMLMMLNQWDGCCIGVPPTPYDAIEVKLAEAAKGDDRLRVSGTVTGILRVDPYLVKDWLVSLYLMDDAMLTIEANAAKRDPSTLGEHQGQ